MAKIKAHRCPNCYANEISIFYEIDQVPVHSVLLMKTKEDALHYPKGDIKLGFCHICGFISNVVFDPNLHEYSSRYEETQGFSPPFNTFSHGLARRLVDRYNLYDKDIIEIGCGKGEFLVSLCELGGNRGVGFDPAFVEERNIAKDNQNIVFIKDFFSEKYSHSQADFICCKMTLEHIPTTGEFLQTVKSTIKKQSETILFFQVPNVNHILENLAFWDIYYEHCSYFSPESLNYLFQENGFHVVDLHSAYDNQYLMIEAKLGSDSSLISAKPGASGLDGKLQYFSNNYKMLLDKWKEFILKLSQHGKRIVIWGGGSKGVAFLTTLRIHEEIEFAIDINPNKHGTFIPGTGQKIVNPDFLNKYKPDIVIVMNPIYMNEIENNLKNLALNPEIISINKFSSIF